MGCKGNGLDLRMLALGLHTSSFDVWQRAVLGWLLLASDESGVWRGRMRCLADGAHIGLTKLKGVLTQLGEAGLVGREKVDGGVRIEVHATVLATALATPSAVSRPTMSRETADHESRDDRWVVATRPMGGRETAHLARAQGSLLPSGTTYPQGGVVGSEQERAREAAPRQPDPTTTTTKGQPQGLLAGLSPDEARVVIERWAQARGVTLMQVTAREQDALLAHLRAHGVELVTAGIASLGDYSKRTGRPVVLAWLPDRIEQAREERKRQAAKSQPVEYRAYPDPNEKPRVEYRAYPEGMEPRVDYTAGEAPFLTKKWGPDGV